MHAYLITGKTKGEREEAINSLCSKYNIGQTDQIFLQPEQESIHINDVRSFQKKLRFKPRYSQHLAGIIYDIHSLTINAQHAVLKTIEEPPGQVFIFAETNKPHTLLATILSRFHIIHLGNRQQHTKESSQIVKDLMSLPLAKRMEHIHETYTTRDQLHELTEHIISYIRSQLYSQEKTINYSHIAKQLSTAMRIQSYIVSNVNVTLIQDYIASQFSQTQQKI